MNSNPDFVSVREAAIIRGVGLLRIYNLLWAGKLEGAVKGPGDQWRIPRASLERKPRGPVRLT
jgi:hypothetical protein